jgi:hypothetical protein
MTVPFRPDELFAALEQHRVDYLVVGGTAAALHGATRPTLDVDILPRDDLDNLERVAHALRSVGARLRVTGLSDDESRQLPVPLDGRWLADRAITNWRTDVGDVDVMIAMPDRYGQLRTYGDLVGSAVTVEIGADPATVKIAGLDAIIDSKRFADRPKDREALIELEQLRTRPRREPPSIA